jgi:hypothetical protein
MVVPTTNPPVVDTEVSVGVVEKAGVLAGTVTLVADERVTAPV